MRKEGDSTFSKHSGVLDLFAREEVSEEDLKTDYEYKYHPALLRALENFRYVLQQKEYSRRGMKLTKLILSQLKNHYTVWHYRCEYLLQQNQEELFVQELQFCSDAIAEDPKGFQTWNHRRFVYEQLRQIDYESEKSFLQKLLEQDSKNYHLWSFRTWVTGRFSLWERELAYIDQILATDVLNNSFWSYRRFISKHLGLPLDQEQEVCWKFISLSPNNESSWSYLLSLYTDGLSQDAECKIISFLRERGDNFFALRALLMDQLRLPLKARDSVRIKEWAERAAVQAPHRKNIVSFIERQLSV